jgi:hypothetical protein
MLSSLANLFRNNVFIIFSRNNHCRRHHRR